MKRISFVITTVFLFFLFASNVSAQGFCNNAPGTDVSGCFFCEYNSAAQLCSESQSTNPARCEPGYFPDPNACAAFNNDPGNPSSCNQKIIPCITTQKTYYCDPINKCTACDTNPATADPDCPANTYPDRGACFADCQQINSCSQAGGVCKTACGPDEPTLSGSCSAATPKCCKIAPPSGATIFCGASGPSSTSGDSIWTAIGCIPFNSIVIFTGRIMRFGVNIAGGIAVLLLILAGFQIMTSAGDKDKLKSGRELLGATITGILMLIFAVFLLRVIGVNILGVLP